MLFYQKASDDILMSAANPAARDAAKTRAASREQQLLPPRPQPAGSAEETAPRGSDRAKVSRAEGRKTRVVVKSLRACPSDPRRGGRVAGVK